MRNTDCCKQKAVVTVERKIPVHRCYVPSMKMVSLFFNKFSDCIAPLWDGCWGRQHMLECKFRIVYICVCFDPIAFVIKYLRHPFECFDGSRLWSDGVQWRRSYSSGHQSKCVYNRTIHEWTSHFEWKVWLNENGFIFWEQSPLLN